MKRVVQEEVTEAQDSIELVKTTKGNTWAIKLYGLRAEDLVDRLDGLNKTMGEKFGVSVAA